MKPCCAVWAGIVALCFAASSCTSRTTPASTPSSQPQPPPETAAQLPASPTFSTQKTPSTKDVTKRKETPPGRATPPRLGVEGITDTPTPTGHSARRYCAECPNQRSGWNQHQQNRRQVHGLRSRAC